VRWNHGYRVYPVLATIGYDGGRLESLKKQGIIQPATATLRYL